MDYRKVVLKTVKIHKDDQMECSAMGLVVESAKFLDFVKKNLMHNQPLDKVNMKKQLAHLRWFLELAAINLDTSMEDIEKLSVGNLMMMYPEKMMTTSTTNSVSDEEEDSNEHEDSDCHEE